MSYFTKRSSRIVAGSLAGALALSVTPIMGLVGTASAADALPPVADPIGAGNFCENGPTTEPFTDVSAADPGQEEIACLLGIGLTTGVTPTTYQPNASITRRQMALFIKRLVDKANELELPNLNALPVYDGTTAPFTDITGETAAVQTAIGQLSQADPEIVRGTTATTYSPAAPVTRRQMAAFINRTQEFLTGTPFSTTGDFFDDDDGDTGEANLNALASKGIFQGDASGNVNPGDNLTRRQMAFVLLRHLQVNFDAGAIKGGFTPAGSSNVRPELVSAQIVRTVTAGTATPSQPKGTYVRYTFDEAVPLAATAANFKVYNGSSLLADAGDAVSIEAGALSVVARFDIVDTAAKAAELSVATVVVGAVTDAAGNTNPEGDAAIGTGSASTLTAGVTSAPDLVSVGGYRQGALIGQTAVDFTFDEAATVLLVGGFSLVATNNTVVPCTASTTGSSGGSVPGGSGTTTITVVCTNLDITGPNPGGTPLSAANIARGAVNNLAVRDADAVTNPLQIADSGNSGNTSGPDLVSAVLVQLNPDRVLYIFDADITSAPNGTLFHAYNSDGTQINGVTSAPTSPVISATDAKQVLVSFGSSTALDSVVGVSVDPNAVSNASGGNQRDEVATSNSTATTVTPGKTAAPDLIGVKVTATNGFVPALATFTFDADVAATGAPGVTDTRYHLYTAGGTRLQAIDCSRGTTFTTIPGTDSAAASPSVTCIFGLPADAATNANVIGAVLGTVEAAATVNDGGVLANPEGAELTTGGTGTRTA